MNGSPQFRVKHSERFDRTYRDFLKEHYKKNRKAAREFEELIARIVSALAVDPRHRASRLEPWPAGASQPGWELRKLEFPTPGLTGDPGQGRLIYVVHNEHKLIMLAWIYTHKQFSGRPPDISLKEVGEGLGRSLAEEMAERERKSEKK